MILGRALWGATLLCAAVSEAGCSRRETNVVAGNRDQILHQSTGAEPNTLDPQTIQTNADFNLIVALGEGLAAHDPHDLHPVPGVAERWDTSADGLTWTFHLRADARWSNGDPVTAQDFLFSYQRILSPALAAQYNYMFYAVRGARDFNEGRLRDFAATGFAAPDPHTLVLTLEHPLPYLAQLAAHWSWFPVHPPTIRKFGRADERDTAWIRPGNHVGNGPFALAAWSAGQEIVVRKNPRYWDAARVRLAEIHFHFIDDVEVEERAFRTGQLHVTYEVPVGKIATYQRESPELLHLDPYFGTYYFGCNLARPPLNDVRVRRALSLALDRRALCANVVRGGQQPATGFVPPGVPGYASPVATVGTDPDEARRLLAEAGFPGGKNFPPVELTFNTNQNHRAIAEAAQEMWRRELGIAVTITNQESKVFFENLHHQHYTLARWGWIADFLDPVAFLETSVSTAGYNQSGYANPEFDRILAVSQRTADPAGRFRVLRDAEALLVRDQPMIPVYFYTRPTLRAPAVRGWWPNALDFHPYKYVWLEN